MAAPREFGLELILKAHSSEIKTRGDVIVLMVHWRLLRHSFLCVGDIHYYHSIPTELLPLNLGWDNDTGVYCLKYSYKRKLYILTVKIEEQGKVITAILNGDASLQQYRMDVGSVLTGEDLIINLQKCLQMCKLLDEEWIEKFLLNLPSDDTIVN